MFFPNQQELAQRKLNIPTNSNGLNNNSNSMKAKENLDSTQFSIDFDKILKSEGKL